MEKVLYAVIVAIMTLILFIVISIVTHDNTSSKEHGRIQQAKRQENRKAAVSQEIKNRELVDTIARPLTETVLGNYKPKKASALKRKLRVTGWDKYLTPTTWMAIRIWCVLIGLLLFFLLYSQSMPAAVGILIILTFVPNLLLNNEFNNINEDLMMNFPETIRVISGYLSAGLIMPKAFEMAARSAKPRWKKILNGFVEQCNANGISEALDWIKGQIDFMEAREFFASIRMAVDDGIDPLESFDKQAKNIQQMLDDINLKKIEKRKMIATVFQGPLLLLILATFALPIVGTMMDFFK